jgi:hypothetical protein
MKVVSANVLDKNEKCVNFVEITVPDSLELTTAKELFQDIGQPFRCAQCFDEHNFEGALFTHQKVFNWNGDTTTYKDTTYATSSEMSKPLGEDEFTIKVVQTTGHLKVNRDADNKLTIQEYVREQELP